MDLYISLAGDKGGLAGFEEFMYKHIVPACFMAPMKPTFDLSDGQTVIALNESATCLKAILEKRVSSHPQGYEDYAVTDIFYIY